MRRRISERSAPPKLADKELLAERNQAAPDLSALRDDFIDAVNNRDQSIFTRAQTNYKSRYCIWRNQSWDGKKWRADTGQQVVPWLGASDVRVPLVDKYVREDVAMLMVIWQRMRTSVNGTEIDDAAHAARLTNVLRWMKYTQMPEARREMRLLANYFVERGTAVMGVFWDYQTQLGYETIDLEGVRREANRALANAAARRQQGLTVPPQIEAVLQFEQLVMDPTQEQLAAELLGQRYSDAKPAELLQAVRDLRETGEAQFPIPYVRTNRPCYVALSPNDDVFMPEDAIDIEHARFIARRELLTETQLVERAGTLGWNSSWARTMIESQKGKFTADLDIGLLNRRINDRSRILWNKKNFFEVIHDYRWMHDSNGVPGIYYTIYAPGVTDDYAYRELLNYAHGEYPFTLFDLETRSRLIDESRGTGERIHTLQNVLKGELDSQIDRASISTIPPMHYPDGLPPSDWGPGSRLPTNHPEDYGWFESPRYDVGSEKVMEAVRHFTDEYQGRPVDPLTAPFAELIRQELGDHFMWGCSKVDTQTLQLMQQWMDDSFYYRVVGGSKGKPIKTTRDEIQGKFDVSISYNIADLDPAKVKEKMGLIETAMKMNASGAVDVNEALSVAFELIDPTLGERLLKSPDEAILAENEDEDNIIAKMAAGIGTDVRPGQNHGLRLQRLSQRIQGTPKLMNQYKQDSAFRDLVDNRAQQLEQQLKQQRNKLIGVLGDQSVSTQI